jgi:hypothetical protein
MARQTPPRLNGRRKNLLQSHPGIGYVRQSGSTGSKLATFPMFPMFRKPGARNEFWLRSAIRSTESKLVMFRNPIHWRNWLCSAKLVRSRKLAMFRTAGPQQRIGYDRQIRSTERIGYVPQSRSHWSEFAMIRKSNRPEIGYVPQSQPTPANWLCSANHQTRTNKTPKPEIGYVPQNTAPPPNPAPRATTVLYDVSL